VDLEREEDCKKYVAMLGLAKGKGVGVGGALYLHSAHRWVLGCVRMGGMNAR
jgi:hypothetical protein